MNDANAQVRVICKSPECGLKGRRLDGAGRLVGYHAKGDAGCTYLAHAKGDGTPTTSTATAAPEPTRMDRRREHADEVLRHGVASGRAVINEEDVEGVLVLVMTSKGAYRQSWAMSAKAKKRLVDEAGRIVKDDDA
jgi:hypothetical protein